MKLTTVRKRGSASPSLGFFDSTAPQDVCHALRDASALVYRTNLAAPNLEVEPLTAAVVVAC